MRDECARCGCEMKRDRGQKPLCEDCLKVPNAGANKPYLGADANTDLQTNIADVTVALLPAKPTAEPEVKP